MREKVNIENVDCWFGAVSQRKQISQRIEFHVLMNSINGTEIQVIRLNGFI